MAPFDPRPLTVSVANDRLAGLAALMPVVRPPAKVRLEPDSITGDPAPGSEARIADAAWMLGRQWQFGELLGEDAGQAVSVRVDSRALPVTGWLPLDDATADLAGDVTWRPWHRGALLEELVQDVPGLGFGDGLRQRSEAGAQLVEMLLEAGEAALARGLAARYPLPLPDDPEPPGQALDPAAGRLLRVLGGAVPDGGRIAAETAAGDPDWIGQASDPAATREVLAAWRDWLLGAPDSGGGWSTERLEYRFAVRFGDDAHAVVTRGTHFGSAQVRWSDLEWLPDAHGTLPADAPDGAPVDTTATMLATPLRHPGMPADRYWQLEDGAVDLGAIEAQPADLARICLAEYAMTSGDDWLGVPLDGLLGALNTVRAVRLTDDFGDTVDVAEMTDPDVTMFTVAGPDGARLPGIVLPPVAAGMLTGPAREEVLFLRDEMANLAWAIEQTVQGPSGDPRSRSAEPAPPPDPWPARLDPDERVYRLQTPIPAHWIPLVPIAPVPGQVALRKGALLRDDVPVEPVGVTLRPTPLTFPGEELPREGVHLRAVPVLARRADGRYVKWSAYRVRTGRGEASSRLAWDAALSIRSARH